MCKPVFVENCRDQFFVTSSFSTLRSHVESLQNAAASGNVEAQLDCYGFGKIL